MDPELPADGLRVAYRPDDEYAGRLRLRARYDGFEGVSEAWADRQEVSQFAQALREYPLDEEVPPSLSLGYGAVDDVTLELVGIEASALGGKGQVILRVCLASESWADGQPRAVHRAVIEFPTSYEYLRRFGGHLLRLLDGAIEQAELDPDVLT